MLEPPRASFAAIVPEVMRKVSVFVEPFRSKEQLSEKTVFLDAVLKRLDKSIARFYADGKITDEINGSDD